MSDDRQTVTKFVQRVHIDGPIAAIMHELQEVRDKFGDEVELWADEDGIEVYVKRMETDDEMQWRLSAVERAKEARRKQYEHLKKEFDNEQKG